MKDYVRCLSRQTVMVFFGAVYGVALLFALFPPLYLWGSGIHGSVLGIPSPIAYWILDAVLLGLGLWGLYTVENIRGELDEEVVTVPVATTSTVSGG